MQNESSFRKKQLGSANLRDTKKETDWQAVKETDRQRNNLANSQRNKQTKKQTKKQIDKETDK